ncbi:GntR family transcriptional regulator [Virgibacillus sp. NKC19-16]|uniref:GntR family transcriptional regulator n=1 Tax=Virgibacillus salidurans TaxID=2831673 RepID=UPI001F32945C|nr:GntR family transcriptional regulator [Virgibacillus sp. NKC19-16]UJL45702.1 GntR family transcriptional regulator [Virgibacillus sp. NKC19-16]
MQLNHQSSVPLHVQLKIIIERQIAYGELKGKIPSERNFRQEYDVSRSTVREAVKLLVREGILQKRPGSGTFVSLKPIHQWLGTLTSTTEAIRKMGMKPGAKLIHHYKMTPSASIQKKTGFKKAHFIKRVRYADDIPIGLECHYYPVAIGEALAQYDLNDATLYEIEEKELGILFAEANQTIGSGIISDEDALLLDIPAQSAVLIAERTIKDEEGSMIELEKAYYRSDMYNFQINLSRKFG